MERTGKTHNHILKAAAALLAAIGSAAMAGCVRTEDAVDRNSTVTVRILCGRPEYTRSSDPDDSYIHDINVFLFDGHGNLEEARYLEENRFDRTENGAEIHLDWIHGQECMAYACVNFGYRMTGIKELGDLLKYRYHMAYPDEYSRGVPMSGKSGKMKIGSDDDILTINLERMMAKVSVRIDRTALNPDIKYNVRSIRIGGSPKSALAFGPSRATGNADIFSGGFYKSYAQVEDLNIDSSPGISKEVSLYMLENMQGNLSSISDAVSEVCSYIEIKAEYRSESMYSRPEEYLIYRCHLGSGPENFDTERNCHYHLTIRPEGDGLREDSWRIDKTGLSFYGESRITLYPGNYIEGKVGDRIRIWAEVTPEGSRLEFGKEELEYDRSRGIYDYVLDKDGHGVTLALKSKGSGIVYIEAGTPTSDAAMVYIEVTQ